MPAHFHMPPPASSSIAAAATTATSPSSSSREQIAAFSTNSTFAERALIAHDGGFSSRPSSSCPSKCTPTLISTSSHII
ncbi:hypothetical protein CVS40_0994 [Lucilia cuprina]|nr:hypothetical protein CVS40_0994 [Lucilia cuprina]